MQYKGVVEFLEAREGFEPSHDGFADHSLRPLGYRASVYYAQILCPILCPMRLFSTYLHPIRLS
ncbi:MAG: hypothetical protein JWN63_3386 [Candidatus Acidoferrum typicum]|nr:hypothetical protein [Candidatus Acidoferrum typicum]